MKTQDYTRTFQARASVQATLDAIDLVGAWWTTSFEGSAKNRNDTFHVHFGDTFVDFRVVEHTSSRIVWHVTNSRLAWLENANEWTGTDVIWDLTAAGDETRVQMTHRGLLPDVECFENCEKGWNFYVGRSLPRLLSEGQGLPDGRKAEHA
jgi:hypothetical protein